MATKDNQSVELQEDARSGNSNTDVKVHAIDMQNALVHAHTTDESMGKEYDPTNANTNPTTVGTTPMTLDAIDDGAPTYSDDIIADDGSVCAHQHFSHRAPWLRAGLLGANDGLISTTALMLGVGAGSSEGLEMEAEMRAVLLSGVASLVAGALSMACGEYISVSGQKDTEMADINLEREEQNRGPEARQAEFEELVRVYRSRGLSKKLAREVAVELASPIHHEIESIVRVHARDELGIDVFDLANPIQASIVSAVAFAIGASIPILAFWLCAPLSELYRVLVMVIVVTCTLGTFGALGAYLGGAPIIKASIRVIVGGGLAMAATFGVGSLFGVTIA